METCNLLQPLVALMVLGSEETLPGLFLWDKCRLEIFYFLPERLRGLTNRSHCLNLLARLLPCSPLYIPSARLAQQ